MNIAYNKPPRATKNPKRTRISLAIVKKTTQPTRMTEIVSRYRAMHRGSEKLVHSADDLASAAKATAVSGRFHEAFAGHRFRDIQDAQAETEKRFLSLAILWKHDRGFSSSAEALTSHPAYLRIIAMGPRAIPLILQELQREPDHWFTALSAVAGVNPIPEGVRGNLDEMRRAWLEWGSAHGFVQ